MEYISQEQISQLEATLHEFYRRMSRFHVEMDSKSFQGVTSVEIGILAAVGEDPDVILKEIAERLQVPGSTLTSAIDRLERRNLLRRTISPRDRRSFGLELTPEGKLLFLEHHKAEQLTMAKILGTLDGVGEADLFLALMTKIVNGI